MRPASAKARIASAFQAVRILSSTAGCTRTSRASNNRLLASSHLPFPAGARNTFVPSQLPVGVAPNASAASSPTSATSSSHDHTKNFPSTPSLSASCDEKKPPSG